MRLIFVSHLENGQHDADRMMKGILSIQSICYNPNLCKISPSNIMCVLQKIEDKNKQNYIRIRNGDKLVSMAGIIHLFLAVFFPDFVSE